MVVLQNLGVERTSVTHAALIFGAVPVFVAAGSALAGRAVGRARRRGPASRVALGGVALVAGSGGERRWSATRSCSPPPCSARR